MRPRRRRSRPPLPGPLSRWYNRSAGAREEVSTTAVTANAPHFGVYALFFGPSAAALKEAELDLGLFALIIVGALIYLRRENP